MRCFDVSPTKNFSTVNRVPGHWTWRRVFTQDWAKTPMPTRISATTDFSFLDGDSRVLMGSYDKGMLPCL